MISDEDAARLECPFEEEEVVGVLKAFNGDRAPGLDGFLLRPQPSQIRGYAYPNH